MYLIWINILSFFFFFFIIPWTSPHPEVLNDFIAEINFLLRITQQHLAHQLRGASTFARVPYWLANSTTDLWLFWRFFLSPMVVLSWRSSSQVVNSFIYDNSSKARCFHATSCNSSSSAPLLKTFTPLVIHFDDFYLWNGQMD